MWNWKLASFVEIVLLVAITKLSAVKVAKASSRGPFENFDKNSWATRGQKKFQLIWNVQFDLTKSGIPFWKGTLPNPKSVLSFVSYIFMNSNYVVAKRWWVQPLEQILA